PNLARMFASQDEYQRSLGTFLFTWALTFEGFNSEPYTLFPAFKIVDPTGGAVFAFYTRLSRSADAIAGFANILNESAADFRARWPVRIKRLNEAKLGGDRDFFSHWRPLPDSI